MSIKNHTVQLAIAFIIGAIVTYFVYPTTQIEERISSKYEKQLQETLTTHQSVVKSLREEIDIKEKAMSSYQESVAQTINTYESEIKELRIKTSEGTYKLIKPDGTIVEKTFKKSETEEYTAYVKTVQEEFNKKINSIEQKWLTIHKDAVSELKIKYDQDYEKKLAEYKQTDKEKIIKSNMKTYGVEAGYTTQQEAYLHTTYTFWGPMFMGGHIQGPTDGSSMSVGVGVGFSL